MKRLAGILLAFILILGIGAYIFYVFYLPELIVEALTSKESPAYVPRRIQNRVDALKIPLNKGSEDVLEEIHKADIPLKEVIKVIDNTSEDEAYALLDELNQTKLENTNQVFDIAKKHFTKEFDAEVFRKPFNDNIDMKMIKRAIRVANTNRKTRDVDTETAKSIIKMLLIQKEKEYKERNLK